MFSTRFRVFGPDFTISTPISCFRGPEAKTTRFRAKTVKKWGRFQGREPVSVLERTEKRGTRGSGFRVPSREPHFGAPRRRIAPISGFRPEFRVFDPISGFRPEFRVFDPDFVFSTRKPRRLACFGDAQNASLEKGICNEKRAIFSSKLPFRMPNEFETPKTTRFRVFKRLIEYSIEARSSSQEHHRDASRDE